jgi:hypothetical protein
VAVNTENKELEKLLKSVACFREKISEQIILAICYTLHAYMAIYFVYLFQSHCERHSLSTLSIIGTLTEHTIFDHFADVCFTRAYYIYYKDSSKTVNEFACTPNEVST